MANFKSRCRQFLGVLAERGGASHRQIRPGSAAEHLPLSFDVERLERRELLSGNVSATYSAGNLKLIGDALDNHISVRFDIANQIFVEGLSGTTVNGAAAVSITQTSGRRLSGNLRINMKGGNDFVEVDDIFVDKDLVVRTGSGDDTIGLFDLEVGDDLSVASGNGADILGLVDVRTGDRLKINTANGDDGIGTASCVRIGGVTQINTGPGGDILVLEGRYEGKLNVKTGSGRDGVFNAFTTALQGTTINLGAGNDLLVTAITVNHAPPILVLGGGGFDNWSVHPLTIFDATVKGIEDTDVDSGVNAAVDATALGLAVLYVARGGDPSDLIC